nr:efflux RND transporter periplasmic adaptor subunit [Candidatus Krumholzibacteria bacterium]
MYVRIDQWVLLTLSLVLLITVHLTGCGEDLTSEGPHDHGSSSTEMMEVTQWSDSLEVFAEFPHLVAGRQAHLMLFLTLLPDGEPVAQGAINLVWTHEAGHHTSRVIRQPDQPGLYHIDVQLPQAGRWSLRVSLDDGGRSAEIAGIHVAASDLDALHHHGPELAEGDGLVTMTKEQQWRLGVVGTPAVRRGFTQPLRVAAKVEAPPSRRIVVTTAVGGRVGPSQEGRVPVLGQKVEAGQILGTIRVPMTGNAKDLAEAEADLIRANEDLQLAEVELERAESLFEAGAASRRRVEEARAEVVAAQARQSSTRRLLIGEEPIQQIVSPIAGMIVAVHAGPGGFVQAGDAVVTVLDASRVWVRGHIPETALEDLPPQPEARLGIHGALREACNIEGAELIYLAPEIDPATRTAAVVYAVDNHDLHLRPGQSLGLALDTITTLDGLVIPVSALVDEHGQPVVFVQVAGETFVKRYVQLGGQDGEVALITSGLREGDRVVVRAPWAVKLAATSTALPGHGHAH